MLPAYLSVLVAGDDAPRTTGATVGRALRCSAALTVGYVLVFGAFGLLLAPVAGWLQPRLPWLTIVLGVLLAALGGWLLAGRSLPNLAARLRAPRLTGTLPSTVLFGMVYAVASLGCAIGPFLALVISAARAGSPGRAAALFVAYAAGMGLVVAVTALAVALVRQTVLIKIRQAGAVVPRLGGLVLLICGAYVAYYGWYERRLALDATSTVGDPVITFITRGQRGVAGILDSTGASGLVVVLLALLVVGWAAGHRRRS